MCYIIIIVMKIWLFHPFYINTLSYYDSIYFYVREEVSSRKSIIIYAVGDLTIKRASTLRRGKEKAKGRMVVKAMAKERTSS